MKSEELEYRNAGQDPGEALLPFGTRPGKTVSVPMLTIKDAGRGAGVTRQQILQEDLATEEPLEIRVIESDDTGRSVRHSVAVTMRTPGHDFELAAGFLFTEGLIHSSRSISQIAYCADEAEPQNYNIVNIFLGRSVPFDSARLDRNFYATSSCGVCGKASLESVRANCPKPPEAKTTHPSTLFVSLPDIVRKEQSVFARTGGLHAAALFDAAGRLLILREDVGRHNAMDKVVGRLLLDKGLPASETLIFVSGRASFELVQKAAMAGIAVLAAVGAPSSLAVSLAREFEMTLIGFLRDRRFNVYCGAQRVA